MHNYAAICLQLNYFVGLEDKKANHSVISNETLNIIVREFTIICQRYTILMTIKHHLQHSIFHNPSKTAKLTLAATHLETAAFRLQQLQVRKNFYVPLQLVDNLLLNCRLYIITDLVWNLQPTST